MKDVPATLEGLNTPLDNERLPYEPPQLLDRGLVSELTQSTFNGVGSDTFYS